MMRRAWMSNTSSTVLSAPAACGPAAAARGADCAMMAHAAVTEISINPKRSLLRSLARWASSAAPRSGIFDGRVLARSARSSTPRASMPLSAPVVPRGLGYSSITSRFAWSGRRHTRQQHCVPSQQPSQQLAHPGIARRRSAAAPCGGCKNTVRCDHRPRPRQRATQGLRGQEAASRGECCERSFLGPAEPGLLLRCAVRRNTLPGGPSLEQAWKCGEHAPRASF